MLGLKHKWKKLSLMKKLFAMTLCVAVLTGSSIIFTLVLMKTLLNDYESNMYQNSICYELQKALEEEAEKFLVYTREHSTQSKTDMEEAFFVTEECVATLPFGYATIGQERYAITWNIINGYEGYVSYRDEFLAMREENPDYVNKLYEVINIQEELSHYALRLTEETLEQGNMEYEARQQFIKVLPVIWFTVLIVSVLLFILLFHGFMGDLVKPLIFMANDAREMAKGNFSTPEVESDREDEVGILVIAFNRMKAAMVDYIHTMQKLHEEKMENLEKEKRLEGAKLEILKSQVNPHFLFNTLNMISCMAKIEEADVTDRMIISMSNLFRYNLRTVEQEVYLEQELEVLNDYVYIQQMRFDNRIQYNKLIEVDEFDVKLPSFTLQPIVENVFVHGLGNQEEGGSIYLHAWMEEANMVISISDDGCGMSEERLEEVRKSLLEKEDSGRGIGIGNICRRIHMLYENGKFEIESQVGKGTKVILTIPQEVVKGEVEHV